MNAALDPVVSRFAALHREREEEAEHGRRELHRAGFRDYSSFASKG